MKGGKAAVYLRDESLRVRATVKPKFGPDRLDALANSGKVTRGRIEAIRCQTGSV